MKRRELFAFLSPVFLFLSSCAPMHTPEASTSSLADKNDPCYMCHIPFTEDDLSVRHLRAGITCSHCHGKSLAHMLDETFTTPPDIVYSREQVNAFCRTCHPAHPNVPPEKLVELWIERNLRFAEATAVKKEVNCTDCHGSHRMARRQTQPER